MTRNVVSCALCGNQFPEQFLRDRGSLQCSCGLRIVAPSAPPHHSLRMLVIVVVTVGLLALVAGIGRHYMG